MKENAKKLLSDIQKFAQALDQDEFQKAKRFLDDKCIYEIGGKEITGSEGILHTYEQVSAWGKQNIEHLEYQSEVQALSSKKFLIRFTDILNHRGKSHTYRCQQEVEVNDRNKIVRITHKEDPFEKQELEAFFQRMGIG